jgi:hypothetical protein
MQTKSTFAIQQPISAPRDQTVDMGPGASCTPHPSLSEPSPISTTPNIRLPLLICGACVLRFVLNANAWMHTNYSQINNHHIDQMS